MENRIGSSHEAEIPKKSRSLDLKSLYQSKGSKESQLKNLKRKAGVDVIGVEKRHERKKSRKAISISSFRKVNGNGSKSLEEVYNGSLSSGSHDSKDSKSGLNQRLNDSSRFSSISQTLEGSLTKIPRRKRGFVGRKKVENVTQALEAAGQASGNLGNADHAGELTAEDTGKKVESVKVKQKGSDAPKEDRNHKTNTGRHFEEEDGNAGHSVVKCGDLSVEKSSTGPSVENNGDSSLKKSLRKRSRKRKNLIAVGRDPVMDAQPSTDAAVKINSNLRDDDEENLEENAARMLSSRFDPSCTGFSSNSKASPNGMPFLLSSDREFIAHGSNYVSGSESASVDTAGRILRPRNRHREKGNSRKRRHYYEVFSGDLDAHWVLNRRIKVFWPLDQSWYYGLVSGYDKLRKLHHVKYDDRDEEWINLQNERFKLLLLPSEVPGKPQRKRSVAREKVSNREKGKVKPSKEKRDLTPEDDSYTGNYMDSEPIISWLARSTHKVKSSPLRALKKQKVSGRSMPRMTSLLSDEASRRHECSGGGSLTKDKCNLSGNFALPERSAAGGSTKVSHMENKLLNTKKFPIVYRRRRFRNASNLLCRALGGNSVSTGVLESDASLGPVIFASGSLRKQEITFGGLDSDRALERSDSVEAFWLSDAAGLLKLNTELVESRQFRFELSLPVPSISNQLYGTGLSWLFHAVLLLQYGTLITMWPRVHLEMLFVDNVVGLRLLLFEGSLEQAIACVLQVLAVFRQPTEHGKFADLQLPVTSIKFKFSCIEDIRKQLVFAFYNFYEVKISKWVHLDSKLQRHCSLTKKLPLLECTYDNIKALHNGSGQLLFSSVCRGATRVKGKMRKSRQCISCMDVSPESNQANSSLSSNSDKSLRWFPPFALSFAAAPTFFLGLHLKLLMERSVTDISFKDHDRIEHEENSGSLLADDCSSVEDSNKGSESSPDNDKKASFRGADCDECLSCAKTKVLDVGISVNNDGWMKSSPKHQNGDVTVETSAISKDPVELGGDDVASLRKWQVHHSERDQPDLSPKSSVDGYRSHTSSQSLLNGIAVEIPSLDQFDKHAESELHGTQQSMDLSFNMNGGVIPSPNPTARRSTWHRNRSSSTTFGYLSHGWSDGRGDFLQNNFSNGPKKPRTQVSYALPFGGLDYGSKNKSHSQKGIPNKRIRTSNEKRSLDICRGSEKNLEMLSCETNVLITLGDRGWREYGAHVVLELFDHEWRLAVKLSGTTKYSYKAHQFLQPGSTNRYTHAMMWKGGKDWILEFPDRSQWALFKEMHEECYNRNIRAASVKNIPIPGVRWVEENDGNGVEVPFVRSSSKYFRQLDSDVEMALDPSRVLYDMDSDDEEWILKNQSSFEVTNCSPHGISEELFEKTMDMFEKLAYSQQREQFTSEEIEELMAGVGPMETIKITHEYWQHKRQKKGMPLIRHLQPPLWEKYQQQLREWELTTSKCSAALPNGYHEKVAPAEKPPMFAFCLKPRGLEVPNRGSKQRSQRKISVTVQSNTFSDHDGFHAYGRRLNGFASGDERVVYQGHNYEPLDDSPLPQISPRMFLPRVSGGKGYFSLSNDRYDRYDKKYIQKLHRRKTKKPGPFVFPNDSQMFAGYNQRMFDNRNRFSRWNMGLSESPRQRHYYLDGPPHLGPEQLDNSDLDDEFRLRDASGAAQHARNMAKLKRERAQRLLYRADLAIHKAVVALMTAEAIKASSGD